MEWGGGLSRELIACAKHCAWPLPYVGFRKKLNRKNYYGVRCGSNGR